MGMFLHGLFTGSLLSLFVMWAVQTGRLGKEGGESFEN